MSCLPDEPTLVGMLICPSCATPIHQGEIRARGVAPCAVCHASVRLERTDESWTVVGHTPPAKPDGVEVSTIATASDSLYREKRKGERFTLSRRWKTSVPTPHLVLSTIVAIVFNMILVAVYIGFIVATIRGDGPPVAAFFAPVLHVGLGIFIGYTSLSQWKNESKIEISEGQITGSAGPLPFPTWSGVEVDVADVDFFEAVQSGHSLSKQRHLQDVVARLRSGEQVTLDKRVEPGIARYIVGQLEAATAA